MTTGPASPSDQSDNTLASGFERALAGSLLLALIPVAVLVLAALAPFMRQRFAIGSRRRWIHPFPVGHQIGLFLLDIDLFFIGDTLLIAAVGFYDVHPGDPLRLVHQDAGLARDEGPQRPQRARHRHDHFGAGRELAEVVVDSPSGDDALKLGGGVALVIVALTIFLRFSFTGSDKRSAPPITEPGAPGRRRFRVRSPVASRGHDRLAPPRDARTIAIGAGAWSSMLSHTVGVVAASCAFGAIAIFAPARRGSRSIGATRFRGPMWRWGTTTPLVPVSPPNSIRQRSPRRPRMSSLR